MMLADWFKKPYPCPRRWYEKVGTSVLITSLVFFVLLSFKPFGISRITAGTIFFISGYCFITLYVMLFSSLVAPLLFTKFFDPDIWTTGKYLIHILGDYLIISFFSWIYTLTAGHGLIEADNFLEFLWLTFTVSIFPVFTIIFLYERIQMNRKLNNAGFLSEKLTKFQSNNAAAPELHLEIDGNETGMLISSKDFICAKSNGNYSMIYYKDNGTIRHTLFRVTMSKLEQRINGNPSIVRCHRSAIVNLQHVSGFSGNERNYFINVNGTGLRINISRTIPAEILEKLRHL
jgi:hypothetical protein